MPTRTEPGFMRTTLLSLVVAILLIGGPARADSPDAPARRPNVLFLMADDMRADMIAALGNPLIQTPNLDGLVRSGFAFRNAYCLGSNQPAVCLPSRYMFLSGRAYFRPHVLDSGTPPNFPTSMKKAGYETYHNGKSGNVAKEIQKQFNINDSIPDETERTSGEPGKILVDQAIRFLRERKKDRPFCMYLGFANPHDPRVAAPKYLDLYDRERIPLPRNWMSVHPFDNGEMTVRDERLAPWPRTRDEIQKQLHDYYAVITAFDAHLGRLLRTLKESGEFENTLIVFSSDHGLALGSHGLMGKQNLYEHSMKSPLVISGPGIPRGTSDALVYLMDIYPSLCELVGAEIPSSLDGKSFVSVMLGRSPGTRTSLFMAYREVQRAVRDQRWKLIRYPQINKSQLFDLRNDPDELQNLADDAAYGAELARLMRLLAEHQGAFGDTTLLTSPEPRDPRFTPPAEGR